MKAARHASTAPSGFVSIDDICWLFVAFRTVVVTTEHLTVFLVILGLFGFR